jgi:membrane fusion protein, heavy metal efflux system
MTIEDQPLTAVAEQVPADPLEPPDQGFRAWLGRTVPMVLSFGLLAGLAYWGHHTDWNFIKSGAHGESTANDDWTVRLVTAPELHGRCESHGLQDCPLCHPRVAQVATTPTIAPTDLERARRTLSFVERPATDPACRRHRRQVEFVSQEVFDKAGIEVAPVWQAAMTEAVKASGELTYDPTRVARLSPRAAGAAW